MSDNRTIPSFTDRLWSEEVGMADPGADFNAPPVLAYNFGRRTLVTDVNTTLYAQPPVVAPIEAAVNTSGAQSCGGEIAADSGNIATDATVTSLQLQIVSAAIGAAYPVTDALVQSAQAQQTLAQAETTVPEGFMAVSSAQAQAVAAAALVSGNPLTVLTRQGQHTAAAAGLSSQATVDTRQAQRAALLAGFAANGTVSTRQGQTSGARIALGSGAAVAATRQAQHSAASLALPPPTTVTYAASNADFSNPERGFYVHLVHGGDFSMGNLAPYKAQFMSLVLYQAYLDAYRTAPLDSTFLNAFQANLDAVRAAGMKTILRFAYTSTDTNDATLSRIQGHLDQLAPYLAANSDVVMGMQCGLVGQWGEFQGSSNFGADAWPPNLSAQDKANRKAVIDKALAVMPAGRFVQVRQPWIKMDAYGSTPVDDTNKFDGSAASRLGHFNDCFLSNSSDSGTYWNQTSEEAFLAADTVYVPMGGETCSYNEPRSSGATALAEMARFHWSFVNSGYHAQVIQSWKTSGDYATISKRLGYRLRLVSGTYPASVARGAGLALALQLANDGFAATIGARTVKLMLRNTATNAEVMLALAADPRTWLPGSTITVNETLTLPGGMAAGSYALFLALPDPASTLAALPQYAIQLANSGMWEAATGYNALGHTLTVT